jgi:hypothetical protein
MSTVADRMKQYRWRKARGRIALLVEVDEAGLIDKLIDGRFIAPHLIDDRAALTVATNTMLGTLITENPK